MSTAVAMDLGIYPADGEDLKLAYAGSDLVGSFKDWRGTVTTFRCSGVIAFSWQPLEYRDDERPDSTYEIIDSAWVKKHAEHGKIDRAQVVRHFRINFNAMGCLEVMCADVRNELG